MVEVLLVDVGWGRGGCWGLFLFATILLLVLLCLLRLCEVIVLRQ